VSEWELRQRREREEERRAEAEKLGAGGEEQPLFLPSPTLSFMAFAEEEQNLLEKLLGAGCMGALLELRGWCYHRNDFFFFFLFIHYSCAT